MRKNKKLFNILQTKTRKNKKYYKTPIERRIARQKILLKLKKEEDSKQKFKLKNKVINHQIKSGNKRTCEKTLLQCVKFFQKISYKNCIKIMQLAVVNTTPIFLLKVMKKLKKRRKKKETVIPFIPTFSFRISYSIKNIIIEALEGSLEKKSYKNLTQRMLLSAYKTSETIKKKNETQEEALTRRKELITRFRWF